MANKKQKKKNNLLAIKENKNNNLKKILACFLISRLILILFLIIKKDLSIFELYDSIHYLNMAKNGYVQPELYAFFPLYPVLIKGLSIILPSYKIAGALISNICALLSLLILNNLIEDNNNHKFKLICFIFSPILSFSSIVYTESLFMLLTILGYYLYKKDKYILSALIVGLSILTRNTGIILWGAVGLDMLHRCFIKKEYKFKKIFIFGIISLSIGMIYPIYLYIKTGDFLKFATVQSEEWGRISGTFIGSIISDIKVIIRNKPGRIFNIMIFLENWLSFFFTLILGIKIFKKDKVSSIYIIVSLIAFTITYRDINYWLTLSSVSLFRYVFNLFPIYIYLLDNKKESTNIIIYMSFILLSLYNTILIYLGAFLA